jgi:hypothetical protein
MFVKPHRLHIDQLRQRETIEEVADQFMMNTRFSFDLESDYYEEQVPENQYRDRLQSYMNNFIQKSTFTIERWNSLKLSWQNALKTSSIHHTIVEGNITFKQHVYRRNYMLDKYWNHKLKVIAVDLDGEVGDEDDMKSTNTEDLIETRTFEDRDFDVASEDSTKSESDLPVDTQVIEIGYWPGMSNESNAEQVIGWLTNEVPHLKEALIGLTIGEVSDFEDISWIEHSDFYYKLLDYFPSLLYFRTFGSALRTLGSTCCANNLLSLALTTNGMRLELLENVIHEVQFPNLAHLCLWIGSESLGAPSKHHLVDLFTRTILSPEEKGYFPMLMYLGLCNYEFICELCKLLPYSAIIQRIRILDLSHGDMEEIGVYYLLKGFEKVIESNPTAFDQLEVLDISHNYICKNIEDHLRNVSQTQAYGVKELQEAYQQDAEYFCDMYDSIYSKLNFLVVDASRSNDIADPQQRRVDLSE